MLRLLWAVALCASAYGQGLEYVKANFTKYEHRIAMRDGVRLFTAVYVPKDTSQKYPILLNRTPYSVAPYGADQYRPQIAPSEKLAKEGFIVVYQDVRGRFQSEGKFVEMTPHRAAKSGPKDIDESTDTYDTIDWLVKNIPNNNGRVGTWGISYPGFYAAAGMIDAHPAHKAASPQAPIVDLFNGDDAYHNGALMLAANFGFYLFFKPHPEPTLPEPGRRSPFKSPDGYEVLLNAGSLANATEKYYKEANPYWLATMSHPTYDEFWQARNLGPHLKNITPAVLTVGGWFDAEDLQGPLTVFQTVQKSPPPTGNHLVMGPWTHGQWSRGDGDKVGDISFGAKTSPYFRDNIEAPFFLYHLKGKGDGKFPTAWTFETGTNRWRTWEKWPPKEAAPKRLYFHAGGKLSFDAPSGAEAFDEFISDPNKPVPYVGFIADGMVSSYLTSDQRHAARRTDVLVYQTDVLEEDVIVAGPILPEIHFSTTGADADIVVKLIDVYPGDYPNPEPNPTRVEMGGYQQLVRGEPFRGKFRHSLSKPEPFTPGTREKIAFTMPDVHHAFRRGHRIMVHIQSSWFPLIDRNPQKFVNIPDAKPSDFQKATHRVHRVKGAASSVGIFVLD